MQNSGWEMLLIHYHLLFIKVYSIPMIILIGWRGANGERDEPQHLVKGKITKKILSLLGIKFFRG